MRSLADGKTYEIECALLKDYVENAGKWVPASEGFVLLLPYEKGESSYNVIPKKNMKGFDGAGNILMPIKILY